ncbi:MAG: nucleoside 2-deoxyribosyltransferase [Labilithrix sp.]|nr:nucleoside 2-deoxyribosyltransferase [Labilithrix sp.]MCW5816567.1 nucleoside 2-deoxyribosyltransferase [Labilithrix sp.]
MPLGLYLSAAIANGPLNARLREVLPASRFELILPQEFTPAVPHADLPRAIYERCIEEMERCDAALLLLDAFGVDCASEAGWLAAKKKPLIGICQASARFLQHWMVKGNLTCVICLEDILFEMVKRDPILRSVPVRRCARHADLGDHIEQLVQAGRESR